MLALPARVRTAADRSSQHIKSAAARTSRRTASTLAREPGRFRYRRRAFGDGVDERGGTAIKSRGRPLDRRSHRLDLVRHHVAVALRLGVSQCALGRGDLLVEFNQFGAQCLGAVLDGAHVGLGSIELGIGGTGYRQPFGCGTFFCKYRFGDAQPVGQLLPRRLLFLQRALEALDRAELTLKKCHGNILASRDHPPNHLKCVQKLVGNVDNIAAEVGGSV